MDISDYIRYFKALGTPTRVQIVWLLKKAERPLCVCEIMEALQQSHYNVSRNLKELKNVRLVNEKKEGRRVFYSLEKKNKEPFVKTLFKLIDALPKELFKKEEEYLKRKLQVREDKQYSAKNND